MRAEQNLLEAKDLSPYKLIRVLKIVYLRKVRQENVAIIDEYKTFLKNIIIWT